MNNTAAKNEIIREKKCPNKDEKQKKHPTSTKNPKVPTIENFKNWKILSLSSNMYLILNEEPYGKDKKNAEARFLI